MKKLLVFGGTKNTGLHIVKAALQQGYAVAVMVREESDTTALKALNVDLIIGDAHNYEDCCNAIKTAQPSYIISTLGGKNSNGERIDAVGNINLINAAIDNKTPLERFLLITSMGSGEQYDTLNDSVKVYLGEALRAKTEAENALKASQLPWSILRPGGLTHEEASHDYVLSSDSKFSNVGYISRADVALASLELLNREDALREAYSVFTILNKAD